MKIATMPNDVLVALCKKVNFLRNEVKDGKCKHSSDNIVALVALEDKTELNQVYQFIKKTWPESYAKWPEMRKGRTESGQTKSKKLRQQFPSLDIGIDEVVQVVSPIDGLITRVGTSARDEAQNPQEVEFETV